MPKKKKVTGRLKKVKLTKREPEQLELEAGEEPVATTDSVAFGKTARRKKFNGELVVGGVVETETMSNGKTRDVVVVDYFTLDKGTVFMERSQHNPNIWYMNTKTEEVTKATTDHEYLVYVYHAN